MSRFGTLADPVYSHRPRSQNAPPGMVGPLEHWAYDTFVARWPDPLMEPAFVTFALDADGKVDRITMKAVSPTADFSFDYHDLLFTPVAAKQ